MTIELDFATGTVKEIETTQHLEKAEDPVIKSILREAEYRQATQDAKEHKLRDPNLPTAKKFVPKVCVSKGIRPQ